MSEQEDLIPRLRALPLFAGLSEDELELITSWVKQDHLKPGTVVFQQGDESDQFYIIASGQVRVTARDEVTGAEVELTRLNAGDFFGEAGLLQHEPRNATVTTTTDTDLYCFTRDGFRVLTRRFPKIKKQIAQRAAGRVHGRPQHFPWMLEDEVPLYVSHRHIVAAFLSDLIRLALIVLLCIIVAVAAFELLPGHPAPWVMISLAVVVGAGIFLWHYVDWINDYFIVTNQRVVHIERVQFIRENRQESPIDMVQNIILQRGWLASRLNYGTLRIEMVGTRVIFDSIPNPEAVQQQILQQRARLLGMALQEERVEMRRALEQALHPAGPPPLPVLAPVPPPPTPVAGLRQILGEWWTEIMQTRIERDGQITWRKHHWILAKQAARPAALTIIGLVITIGLFWLTPRLHWPVWLFGLPVITIGAGLTWWEWEDWRNDLYILTPDRIIDIERLPLGLRESRREGGLDRIQDIEVVLPTLWATIFNIGNVVIKTAAAGGDFTFNDVSDPRSVQRDIFRHLARHRRQQQIQERQRRFAETAQWFSVYTDIMSQSVRPPGEG